MFGPKCQSCGMPLSKDPQKGGTNQDGTLSTEYCSYCYQQGSFTEPDITVDQMIDKVNTKLKEMWIPGFLGKYFTRGISQLKRWK